MKCKLITTVSDPTHPGWLTLRRSLDKFGWDYDICGTEYHQFGSKMVNAYNYAKKTDCTHLFIVDAYDVIALGTMQEALGKIPNKNIILFNAEINCWPYEQWAMLYPKVESRWKYLNGGMCFVEVERFCRMFEENPIGHNDNDQPLLARTLLRYGSNYNMQLDTRCEVFQTLCGTTWDDFVFVDNRIINKETGTRPVLFHGNGRADMKPIIELL